MCSREEAEQVVAILKAEGRTVDAVYYPEEGHGFVKREHQRDELTRSVAEIFCRALSEAVREPIGTSVLIGCDCVLRDRAVIISDLKSASVRRSECAWSTIDKNRPTQSLNTVD